MATQDNPGEMETRTVKALGTSLDILEALCDVKGGTVTEIGEHIGVSTSAVHAHLQTMEKRGYVTRDGFEYRPSLRYLGIGEQVKRDHIDIYEAGREEIKTLAKETGEFGWIMVEERGHGIFVSKEAGENAVETGNFPPGKPTPLQATAAGKSILAHLPEDARDEILEQTELRAVTQNTITDPDVLRDQLETIRDRGYALSSEESVHGIRSVAAPVLSADQEVLGAISISGPVSRIGGERFRETLPDRLIKCSNVVEINAMRNRGSSNYSTSHDPEEGRPY